MGSGRSVARRTSGRSNPPAADQVLRQDQAGEERRIQRRHPDTAAAELGGARREDGQRVHRGEEAVDATGEVDAGRDQEGVQREVQIRDPRALVDNPEQGHQPEAGGVGDAEENEVGIDRTWPWRPELERHGQAEQNAGHDEPEDGMNRQRLPQPGSGHPASLLIRPKIGMYIAITIPPTTPPRKTIITGSSRVSCRPRPSTSSS